MNWKERLSAPTRYTPNAYTIPQPDPAQAPKDPQQEAEPTLLTDENPLPLEKTEDHG